jgi:hypothetical protein
MNASVAFCSTCGSPFTPRRATRRFCTSRCRVAAHRAPAISNATTAPPMAAHALKSVPGISRRPPALALQKSRHPASFPTRPTRACIASGFPPAGSAIWST